VSLLDDVSTRGAEVRTRLRDLLLNHEYPGNTKNLLLMGYAELALEHHEAIWLLIDAKLYGSAYALVRPVYDVMLRGHWISKCASPEEIEAAFYDEDFRFPRSDKLLADIKREYLAPVQPGASDVEPEQADLFIQQLQGIWNAACSYTHSGSLQLLRRFTDDHVKPNYTDDDIVQVLRLATAALFLLLNMFFVSMEKSEEAREVRTMLQKYTTEFKDRFGGGGESKDAESSASE
jgi:hypothetical protein